MLTTYEATSSGGSGASENPYSDSAQRGKAGAAQTAPREESQDAGAVEQSMSGGILVDEVQNARQGVDVETRRAVDTRDGFSGGRDGGSQYDGVGGPGSTAAGKGEYAENREQVKGRLGAPTRFVG
jgi:hypothetical protein